MEKNQIETPVINLRGDYRTMLRLKGIYDQWKVNVINYCERNKISLEDHIAELNTSLSFGHMIASSFWYGMTNETPEYWEKLAED